MRGQHKQSEWVWVLPATGRRYHETPNCPAVHSGEVVKRIHRSRMNALRESDDGFGYEPCRTTACREARA